MARMFETIRDFDQGRQKIIARRYGVIEVAGGSFVSLQLRPWPKLISIPEVIWMGKMANQTQRRDRCWIYYNQPMGHSRFLTLQYIVSSLGTTLRTFRASLIMLDEVARLKQIDAIVGDLTNNRISDRLLERWGWEHHLPNSRRRNVIKRFYGEYPPGDEARELIASTAE